MKRKRLRHKVAISGCQVLIATDTHRKGERVVFYNISRGSHHVASHHRILDKGENLDTAFERMRNAGYRQAQSLCSANRRRGVHRSRALGRAK